MLDTFTLLVLLCLTHFLSTTGLAVVWWINREIPGLGEWALGRLVGVFGLGVLALRLWVDPAIVILLGNVLLMIGFSIVLAGHRKFMERAPFPPEGFALALLLFVSAFGYFLFVDLSFPARAAIAAAFFAGYGLLTAWSLWPSGGLAKSLSCKLVAALFVGHAIFNLICMGLALINPVGTRFLETALIPQATLLEGVVVSLLSLIGYITMVTERLQRDLRRQAEIDPLTGAYNRRAFHTLARQMLLQRKRLPAPVSVVLMDIDHFKSVNDRYGHAAGDRVLKEVVALIRGILREADILCRFGGEEFIVLLPTAAMPDALAVSERIRSTVERRPIEAGDGEIAVTLSLGVCTSPAHEACPEIDVLISQADEALYRAKMSGRNTVRSFIQETYSVENNLLKTNECVDYLNKNHNSGQAVGI